MYYFFFNCFCKCVSLKPRFSGLRGAMAFALALNIPIASGTAILTTTLVICVFTVIVLGNWCFIVLWVMFSLYCFLLGGLTGTMLKLLDIDMHLDPRLASDDDEVSEPNRFAVSCFASCSLCGLLILLLCSCGIRII